MAKAKNKHRSSAKAANPLALKPGMSIGAADAADDKGWLFQCFEDSGLLSEIRSLDSAKFIIKGRTGSGKSALLLKLEREAENVIRIDPGHLCLQHISNSDILRFIEKNEVRLEPFLEIIWKHTFATELLRRKYRVFNADTSVSIFSQLINTVHASRRRSIEYLRDFGLEIWPEFEERVTAVTKKVEDEIKAELGLAELGFPLTAGGTHTTTLEEKQEIRRRIQKVLGANQLSRLQTVIQFMADEVFTDARRPYYVIIDDLDRFHVDDAIRLRLIRALIDVVKKFRPISNVKFCIALRSDLLEEIFEKTRDQGFQEEKYDDSIITIRWNRDQLFRLIEKRISELYRRKHTKDNVKFYDVFAEQVAHQATREYILDRTLMRPRDAILFVNECLERGADKLNVGPAIIKDAESTYSRKRLDSLRDEWLNLYPLLPDYLEPLRGKPSHFEARFFDAEEMRDLALKVATTAQTDVDRLGAFAIRAVNGAEDFNHWAFEKEWLRHLYKVGVLGIKNSGYATMLWSYKDKQEVLADEISLETRVEIHPMVRLALGTIPASGATPGQRRKKLRSLPA